ncbi:MAG: hypothetical protein DRG83_13145 [Deltaproteobacteria bacterium]|nr:MAG: hypothetical protein DRG83_13145 [Deltaproteobacteria bacterium]
MLVRYWMSRDVITIDENESLQKAAKVLQENQIKILPVMRNGTLVGVITDRDVKRASASDATTLDAHELHYLLSKLKIKEIMTKNPITVPDDYTVEEVAGILLEHKISGVPVVNEEGKLVGVITKTDLFKLILALTGARNGGVQFAFQIEDRPGSIKEVTDIFRKYGGRMASILSSRERCPEGYRFVYIRMYELDRQKIPKLKEEIEKTATMLYMVDHSENRREIYV